ncbi:MAG: hypothetical protein NVSMB49_05230 [Ktedonobacteraceae bacterium]
MSEHLMAHGVSFQGLTFRYTEHGTLLITLGGSHEREFNPREAADLLTYLNTSQGDLFKNASEGDMETWPQRYIGMPGESQIARNILDSYEKMNAYSEDDDGKHHDGE